VTTARTCLGGLLDGKSVTIKAVGAWVWLDAEGREYDEPGSWRMLYWLIGDDALHFGGHGSAKCEGCQSLVDPEPETGGRRPSCPLCGGRTVAA
jgi:hypothetical protein